MFPAGAVTGTLEDFARFGQALVAADCQLFEDNATRDGMFKPVSAYGDTGIAKNCLRAYLIRGGLRRRAGGV